MHASSSKYIGTASAAYQTHIHTPLITDLHLQYICNTTNTNHLKPKPKPTTMLRAAIRPILRTAPIRATRAGHTATKSVGSDGLYLGLGVAGVLGLVVSGTIISNLHATQVHPTGRRAEESE
jgi:glycerol-3-phosphate dehydrogenase